MRRTVGWATERGTDLAPAAQADRSSAGSGSAASGTPRVWLDGPVCAMTRQA